MALLDRYLGRTILLSGSLTAAIFMLLFGGYHAALLLARAADGELPADVVAGLVLLKLLIALEVILPIAFYLGIVLGLGRLSSTSELIAMAASSYSERRLLAVVMALAFGVALLTLILSFWGRPWAYRRAEFLSHLAKARFDVAKMEARRFFLADEGRLVLFAEAVDRKTKRLDRVFFQKRQGKTRYVIYARRAQQSGESSQREDLLKQSQGEQEILLHFHHGYAYHFNPEGPSITIRFKTLDFRLRREVGYIGYRSKATPLPELWQRRNRPKDLAELQWRLSRPLSALILAFLAVPLGRSHPRKGQSHRLLAAILLFALYYNLAAMAKTWVKEGVVGAFPGLFWPEALFLILAWALWRWLK